MKKQIVFSIVVAAVCVIIVNVYFFFIAQYLPVKFVKDINDLLFLPFLIGIIISKNSHQPSVLGFNLALFIMSFGVSFLISLSFTIKKNIRDNKGSK